MTRRIDLTPSWEGILPALILFLESGSEDQKRLARSEFKKMARLADEGRRLIELHGQP